MGFRKMMRNPGWWRLFIVLTGLWYGGWLIGAGYWFYDEVLTEPERPGTLVAESEWPGTPVTDPVLLGKLEVLEASGYDSREELEQAFERVKKTGNFEETYRLENFLKRYEKGVPKLVPLATFRQHYPEYDDLSDQTLANLLHWKFFPEMDRSEFNAKLGLNQDSFADLVPQESWYRDSEILKNAGGILLILLFPWGVFLVFRMVRYVIEGFVSE